MTDPPVGLNTDTGDPAMEGRKCYASLCETEVLVTSQYYTVKHNTFNKSTLICCKNMKLILLHGMAVVMVKTRRLGKVLLKEIRIMNLV